MVTFDIQKIGIKKMKQKSKVFVLGCNGYIGFPLCMRLLNQGYRVVGIDNLSRESSVNTLGSVSASKSKDGNYKHDILHQMGNFTFIRLDISKDNKSLYKLIDKHTPDSIVNLAHNPSAPYSMMDHYHADHVLVNNITGTNNILWAIKECCPDTHYITIGSTGEYQHDLGVDIEEGYFTFKHNNRESKECLFPRCANSLYHASKISSTYIIDYLTRVWDLKCTDIMQSIVYGLYTDECDKYNEHTRIDTDECYGTVLNRFVVQSILKEPLTKFGHGMHQRAFISLNDSIQALMIAIENPSEKGKVQTWNQLSEWLSINNLIDIIKDVSNYGVRVKEIDSPRKEFTGGHYYNLTSDILPSLGYKPTRSMKQEIEYMINNLHIPYNKERVLKKVIQPKILF